MIGRGGTCSSLLEKRASALRQDNLISDMMLEKSKPRTRSCGNLKFIWGLAYTCVCTLLLRIHGINLLVFIIIFVDYLYSYTFALASLL